MTPNIQEYLSLTKSLDKDLLSLLVQITVIKKYPFDMIQCARSSYYSSQGSRYEGVLTIIQRQVFLFLNENICCDPSLEPSQRDGSNDGSQNMFLWSKVAYYP